MERVIGFHGVYIGNIYSSSLYRVGAYAKIVSLDISLSLYFINIYIYINISYLQLRTVFLTPNLKQEIENHKTLVFTTLPRFSVPDKDT